MNEFLKVLYSRKSCRSFQKKEIAKDELDTILQAGIQAPSAMNRQLCELYAITDQKVIDKLADAIRNVFNERGDQKPDHYHFAYHCPTLVIVSGPEYDSCYVEDGSCILENIFLTASYLNIGSCWIHQLKDTQNVDEVRKILTEIGIPANHQVVGCAALGYVDTQTPSKEKNPNRIHII